MAVRLNSGNGVVRARRLSGRGTLNWLEAGLGTVEYCSGPPEWLSMQNVDISSKGVYQEHRVAVRQMATRWPAMTCDWETAAWEYTFTCPGPPPG